MLDNVAGYLIKKETITGAQMMAILDGRDPDQEEYYGVKAQQDPAEPAAHFDAVINDPIPMPEYGRAEECADAPAETDDSANEKE